MPTTEDGFARLAYPALATVVSAENPPDCVWPGSFLASRFGLGPLAVQRFSAHVFQTRFLAFAADDGSGLISCQRAPAFAEPRRILDFDAASTHICVTVL